MNLPDVSPVTVTAVLSFAGVAFAGWLKYRSDQNKANHDNRTELTKVQQQAIKDVFEGSDQFQERLMKHLETLQRDINEGRKREDEGRQREEAGRQREEEMRKLCLTLQARDVERDKVIEALIVRERKAIAELERVKQEHEKAITAGNLRYAALEVLYHNLEADKVQLIDQLQTARIQLESKV